jgi:type II secretory pathway component PulK
VLLIVLVIVVMLALAAYQFSELMLAEAKAADSANRTAQARAMALSGIHYSAALLSNSDSLANTLNSNPWDNTAAFQGILVQDNDQTHFRGRFSVIAPLGPDDIGSSTQPYRFGVIDENGKINLNAVMQIDPSGSILYSMLMTLPNMTDDVANSIIDWLDADEEPRSNGAESEYYSGLNPPYSSKNGPLDSLEELLLVKGVTPQLLYGNDLNHNGILDPDEDDGSGQVDLGWQAYLTVYSRERNIDSTGSPRIWINDTNLDTLYTNLNTAVGQDLANYIIAWRMYGGGAVTGRGGMGGGAGGGGMGGGAGAGGGAAAGGAAPKATPNQGGAAMAASVTPSGQVAVTTAGGSGASNTGVMAGRGALTRSTLGSFSGRRSQTISSLYALVNSQVTIPASGPGQQNTTYPSPLNDPASIRQYLPLLLDKVTTTNGPELPARVNVNTAPSAVLAALPGLSEADVQAILGQRPNPSASEAPDPIYQTPAWLITEANLSPNALQTLERYVTASSQVYRVQSLGYFDGGGPTARIEAVIDTNGGRPRIIYFRDLTELGKGFTLPSNQ